MANNLAPATTRQKRPPQITAKVRSAIRRMVHDGVHFPEAAVLEGMTAASLRKALARPHVLSYLRVQRQLFRAALCAKNDFRLAAIRDQDDNKLAVVQAVRALERLTEEDEARPANQRAPGIVIQIIAAPQRAEADELRGGRVIDITPLRGD